MRSIKDVRESHKKQMEGHLIEGSFVSDWIGERSFGGMGEDEESKALTVLPDSLN